ncbi:hypothetical protein ACOSQ4_022335 [Xanthoceras sorbifolium]
MKFFHAQASSRKKRNAIVGLRDGNGGWSTDVRVMESTVLDYFRDIFGSSTPSPEVIGAVVDTLDKRVSSVAYKHLDGVFTGEEVRHALFQMAPSKAPGLDGFTAGFYQRFWSVIGDRVTKACLGVLNDSQSLVDINLTLIVLIPKVDHAESMGDFRPISLCNVIYNIEVHVHGSGSPPAIPAIPRVVSWRPPTVGSLKLNTDASLGGGLGWIGLGFIVRDSEGSFVTASTSQLFANFSPQVESDSLSVVNFLVEQFIPLAELGLIISNILHGSCLTTVSSFFFVPRVANLVADALAKATLNFYSDYSWLDSCPPFMEGLLQADRPG